MEEGEISISSIGTLLLFLFLAVIESLVDGINLISGLVFGLVACLLSWLGFIPGVGSWLYVVLMGKVGADLGVWLSLVYWLGLVASVLYGIVVVIFILIWFELFR